MPCHPPLLNHRLSSTLVGYPSCYGTGVEEAGVEEGPHVQHRLHRLPRLHRQHWGIRRSASLDVRLYAPKRHQRVLYEKV